MGDVSSATMDQGWAFGPQPGTRTRRTWWPFGLAAGVVAGLGVATAIGFIAFVTLLGQEDAAAPAAPAQSDPAVNAPATASVVTPVQITGLRLTDSVDAVTGEPGNPTSEFAVGEPVRLWLSFEAGDQSGPLTAVWFRGDNKVARMTAPLPDTTSQMVFPLPQLAADRPGSYRVEVRSGGDVLAAETFEVTNG